MRIFLSYSTQDQLGADALRRALLERRPDLNIYFAPHRNDVGAYWISRLEQELEAADAVLLLLGERVGPWQELEYYDALRRNRQYGRPTLAPVLLARSAPGLPFLDQFHQLSVARLGFRALVERVLAALDGTRPAPPEPGWRLHNPYRGLLAMEPQDAAYFFGREAVTAQVLSQLAEQPQRLHMLIGNSGVGKSSVALAGVLGALKSQLWPGNPDGHWPQALAASHGWPVVRLTPGTRPLKALAEAFVELWREDPAEIDEESRKWQDWLLEERSLSDLVAVARRQVAFRMDAEQPQRIVLYVDQGEELYTRADAAQARRFSQLVGAAVGEDGLLAMLTLRADYYGRMQDDAPLFAAAAPVDVPPLDREALEQVVRQPAELLGVSFENDEAVEQIVAAAVRQPGALPLLSDLLSDAWSEMLKREDPNGVLRLPPGFLDISRPLADKGERFLAANADGEDELRRLITLKLSLQPREGEILRRRARRGECSAEQWALLEAMSQPAWRLIVISAEGGEPTAEVAHEALLRHWPRVVDWLAESREFLVWRSRFEVDYRSWEDAGDVIRERTLLTGLQLDVACRWLRDRSEDLSESERIFISDSQRAASEARLREQRVSRRVERQRRSIMVLVVVALLVVSAIAVQAFKLRDHAEVLAQQERLATRQARLEKAEALRQAERANARRLAMASRALIEESAGDIELAGLLAAQSLRLDANVEGRAVARQALELLPAPGRPMQAPWPHARLTVSADGSALAFSRQRSDAGREATEIVFRRTGDQPPPDRPLNSERLLTGLALSPDGGRLAAVDAGEGVLLLWDTASGERLLEEPLGAYRAAFSSDGQLAVTARGQRLLLLHGDDGRELGVLGAPGGVEQVGLAADRRSLVSFGLDGRFRGWDSARGRQLWASSEVRPDASGVELSADGRRFADRSADGTHIAIGDTADGRQQFEIPVSGRGTHLLSRDGRRLVWLRPAAGERSGELQVWDLAQRRSVLTRPIEHALLQWAFLPGSNLFALSAGRSRRDEPEGHAVLIDVDRGKVMWRAPLTEGTDHARLLPMSPKLLALSSGSQLRLLADDGEFSMDLGADGVAVSASAAQRGGTLIFARRPAAGGSDRIELRTIYGGHLQRTIDSGGRVGRLVISEDGKVLIGELEVDRRHWVVAWRFADGARLAALAVEDRVAALYPLADPDLLAVHTLAGQLGLWRISTSAREQVLSHVVVAREHALATASPRAVTWLPGRLTLWDAAKASALADRRAAGEVQALAISPDGGRIAYLVRGSDAGEGDRLMLWAPGDQPETIAQSVEQARALRFDPQGRWLVAHSGRDRLRLFDAATLKPRATLSALPGAQLRSSRFSADGSLLLVEERRDRQRALRAFEPGDMTEVARWSLPGPWQAMPAGATVAVASREGGWSEVAPHSAAVDVRLLAAKRGELVRPGGSARVLARVDPGALASVPAALRDAVIALPAPGGRALNAWAVDGRGERLAVLDDDGVAIHDAADGRRIAEWAGARFEGAGIAVGHHLRPIRELAFVGDGYGLVARDTRGFGTRKQRSRLWLWRWLDGGPRLLSEDNPINRVALSPDGELLATAEGGEYNEAGGEESVGLGEARVRLWDARSGTLERTIRTSEPVDAVAFSADSRQLALRTSREVAVFAGGDWHETARFAFEGRTTVGGSVLFAAGGRQLVADAAGGVMSWALDDDQRRLLRHESDWPRVETSADGALLLSRSRSFLRIWDAASGAQRFELALEGRAPVDALLFGDEHQLLLIDGDGLGRVRWQPDELLAELCRRAGRDFSDDERQRFLEGLDAAPACGPSGR